MTSTPSRIHRTDIAALTLALAVGLTTVACAGSGAASASVDPRTPSPSATARPTASLGQVATASPRSSPTTVAGTPTPHVPAAVEIDDPALRMTLPEGWAEYPMDTYRLLIDSFAKASSPEVQAFYARHLKDVDSGAVKLAAGGFIGGAVGSLIIQVDSGDRSLDAAVTRLRDLGMTPTDSTLVDERSATLRIGKAVRLVETHAVPAGVQGVPSRTVQYIARLDDGRTLWILASGPAAAPAFEALIDASVMSLRSR